MSITESPSRHKGGFSGEKSSNEEGRTKNEECQERSPFFILHSSFPVLLLSPQPPSGILYIHRCKPSGRYVLEKPP
jgi:hypothetical protein